MLEDARIILFVVEYELSAYKDNSPVIAVKHNQTAALQDGKPVFDAGETQKRILRFAITNYDW